MTEFEAMKAVYCYFCPEVEEVVQVVDNLSKGSLFRVLTPMEEAQKHLHSLSLNPSLDLPQTPQGYLNLDMIHEPVIQRIRQVYQPILSALENFPHHYPTHGSSEGIFHYLAHLRSQEVRSIYTLFGEYEGYREYGKTLGIATQEINPETQDLEKLEPGFWFISNPSARDGNFLPEDFVNNLGNLGHKIALDLAYVGATKPQIFDLSHPNIDVAFLSFSKPYGLFRERVGFLFSRHPMDSLYGNKWFDHAPALLIALKAAEDIGPHTLYEKYRPFQEKIIADINQSFHLRIRPSDVFLLGNLKGTDVAELLPKQLTLIKDFQRGSGYRFCLTPYFERMGKK